MGAPMGEEQDHLRATIVGDCDLVAIEVLPGEARSRPTDPGIGGRVAFEAGERVARNGNRRIERHGGGVCRGL